MRGAVDGLASSHRLGLGVPALYQDDEFLQRLLAGLDHVLAPVLCTIDNLHAYLAPQLAPDDFVSWLAGWLGVPLDEEWSTQRRRAVTSQAVERYGRVGTLAGLRHLVETYVDGHVDVDDSGGVMWSVVPGAGLPGRGEPAVTVQVRSPDPDSVDVRRLEALVAAATPAHVAVAVEVSADDRL